MYIFYQSKKILYIFKKAQQLFTYFYFVFNKVFKWLEPQIKHYWLLSVKKSTVK